MRLWIRRQNQIHEFVCRSNFKLWKKKNSKNRSKLLLFERNAVKSIDFIDFKLKRKQSSFLIYKIANSSMSAFERRLADCVNESLILSPELFRLFKVFRSSEKPFETRRGGELKDWRAKWNKKYPNAVASGRFAWFIKLIFMSKIFGQIFGHQTLERWFEAKRSELPYRKIFQTKSTSLKNLRQILLLYLVRHKFGFRLILGFNPFVDSKLWTPCHQRFLRKLSCSSLCKVYNVNSVY